MLIHLEKAGTTVGTYTIFMESVIKKGGFKASKMLPNSTITETNFITKYTDGVIYYFKKDGNHCYFLKYEPNLKMASEIIVNITTKVVTAAEIKMLTDISAEYIKQLTDDE